MEHIPLHESVDWLKKSKSTVKLLKSFFNERMELELDMEAKWKIFASKWERNFMDLEKDPLLQSKEGDRSLADILRLLVKEPEDNATVCCSVKSLLQRKRNSPTALLKKWISTYNSNCIDEYRITYLDAVESMAESEKNVIRTKRILSDDEDVQLAYSEAVDKYKKEKATFEMTMMQMQNFLEKTANSKMEAIKESLQQYVTVISEYDEQKMARNQRLLELTEQLEQFSTEKTVDRWVTDLQEPIMFPDYESDVQRPSPKRQKVHPQPQKYRNVRRRRKYVVREPFILTTIVEDPETEALMEQKQEAPKPPETLKEARVVQKGLARVVQKGMARVVQKGMNKSSSNQFNVGQKTKRRRKSLIPIMIRKFF